MSRTLGNLIILQPLSQTFDVLCFCDLQCHISGNGLKVKLAWVKKSVNSNRQLCAQCIVLDMVRGIANDQ